MAEMSASAILGLKLDSIPFSAFHAAVILLLVLVGFIDGYDLALTGSLLVLAKGPLHITPDQIRWLTIAAMRVFGAIIFSQPLLMWAGQSQTPERGGVGAQLVGDQQFRHEALLLEQLAHQPRRRPTVAPTLNQYVEDLAFMVDGSPQKHPLARDPNHHLVEVPAIARPRAAPTQPSRDHRSER